MTSYIVRRVLYAIPILLGVNILTFILFFGINSPDDMARLHLPKNATRDATEKWKRERNYHLPTFHNDGYEDVWIRDAAIVSFAHSFEKVTPGDYAITVETPDKGSGDVSIQLTPDTPSSIGTAGHFQVKLGSQKKEIFKFQVLKSCNIKLEMKGPKDSPSIMVRLKQHKDPGLIGSFTETIFFQKSVRFLFFDFGKSDDGRIIGEEIGKRIGPSLTITIPTFILGLLVEITIAMIIAYMRGSYLDFWSVIWSVVLMSVSILFYVIGGQWLFAKTLKLFPVSGFDADLHAIKFTIMPIVIGIIGGIGSGVLWFRTIFLEEVNKDYVRTARSKGLSESKVLFKHVLKNAMIPILTTIVVSIPFLFIGGLIMESFFSIPGMGAFMIEAIDRQDFAIVQAMVFIGSVLYIIGLVLTDISYTFVDPRVRLE
jgi:peptide/nickel transport system permease protein